ncbi:hypothetical protein C8A01DRAFT_48252 [Parachaetomium inaequale]|uniref:ABM domain-containing protein n=1 Tax=Parachaetomium inaequale TaxID=2588326 RepID=A0AAN6SQ19_9PEZI|nr:hypothetical protein C8A01DRAFT_48252 [Parachaetomium inaequale]
MARTKQRARRNTKALILTWTRFYLPREQKWPTWSVDHAHVHIGPLAGVEGCRKTSLGRMVENPEQAAYIIEWATLDALNNFQSSPACAEFLRNFPEDDNSPVSIESGSAQKHLTLDDGSSSSPPVLSRFLVLKHIVAAPTSPVEGRVTLTTFMVPRKSDTVFDMWYDNFKSVFHAFVPRGSEFTARHRNFWYKFSAVWFWVLAEDQWVEEKFGKLEQTPEDDQRRTILCHFYLWLPRLAIARVMPPATAWAQERWDIREVPRFYPPDPEFDSEEDPEYEEEQERLKKEYLEFHGFEVDEGSQ